jgi:CubicO group peptidase (beta-lactamase class C family)
MATRRNIRWLFVSSLILVYCTGAMGISQVKDSELAVKVNALLAGAAQDGFGGAVIIERDGRVVLSKGYGLANRPAGIPFTVDTIALISSITKSFTALAVLQLAAAAKSICKSS